MVVESRPSIFHWFVAAIVVLIISAMAWIPILFIVAQYLEPERRLLVSLLGVVLVMLSLMPLAIRSGRAARWKVDLEGLESPAVGRISFSSVVALYIGYPTAESVPMTAFHSIIAPGSRGMIAQTLILRLSDGQLLPLNLAVPSIRDGAGVMAKLEELLAGRKLPQTGFSPAEIAALKSRPMNRMVLLAKPRKVPSRLESH